MLTAGAWLRISAGRSAAVSAISWVPRTEREPGACCGRSP
jgi:hypothetical protein